MEAGAEHHIIMPDALREETDHMRLIGAQPDFELKRVRRIDCQTHIQLEWWHSCNERLSEFAGQEPSNSPPSARQGDHEALQCPPLRCGAGRIKVVPGR